jgi:hypothetical protein
MRSVYGTLEAAQKNISLKMAVPVPEVNRQYLEIDPARHHSALAVQVNQVRNTPRRIICC